LLRLGQNRGWTMPLFDLGIGLNLVMIAIFMFAKLARTTREIAWAPAE